MGAIVALKHAWWKWATLGDGDTRDARRSTGLRERHHDIINLGADAQDRVLVRGGALEVHDNERAAALADGDGHVARRADRATRAEDDAQGGLLGEGVPGPKRRWMKRVLTRTTCGCQL